MSTITNFLNLLKGGENDYFDYILYLNDNWDKIDESIRMIYERDKGIYINEKEFGAVGNALYKNSTDNTLWGDSLFRVPAKDNHSIILSALNKANLENKTLIFPKVWDYLVKNATETQSKVLLNKYFIKNELIITGINNDIVFEKDVVIVGNVKIYDVKNIAFTNVTIEGDLTIDSIENCKFLNLKVTGKTRFGTSIRGKDTKSNSFINCNFNSADIGFEFYCSDSVENSNKNIKLSVAHNSFISCNFIGTNYGIYSNVPITTLNSEVKHNLFLNSKAQSSISDLLATAISLGNQTSSFNFIEQTATGKIAMNLENSIGHHIFTGGLLQGEMRGLNQFLMYKPTSSNTVSYDKLGNNINNMRKMKVFGSEVPKWKKVNVEIYNDSTTNGFTGDSCLKIVNLQNSSFPTLERTFSVSDHLNQTVNVVARIKSKSLSTANNSDAAIVLTNGVSSDIVTTPIISDDIWRVVTAKISLTQNKNITIKLSPNNSYNNSINELYVDWVIIALGDFVQFSSVPAEEHHYSNLTHYGDFSILGNSNIKGSLDITGDLSVGGVFLGDVDVSNGKFTILRDYNPLNPIESSIEIGNNYSSSVNDLSTFKYKINVEGNELNQILKIYAVNRDDSQSEKSKLEEILELTNNKISYKGKELHHDGNTQGAGSNRPTNPVLGRSFFDIALNRPIWWNGVSWVDANGVNR